MASSSNILTIASHEKAGIDSITSAAAGFPKENMLDHNLDTYWKPTSSGNQLWDVDLGAAFQIDGVAIWIHNYDTDHGPNGVPNFSIAYSDDNFTGITVEQTFIFNTEFTVGVPLMVLNFSAGSTHRWWRMAVLDMATTIEISHMFLYRKRAITIGNQWPENDEDIFHNNRMRSRSGRQFVTGINRQRVRSFKRQWLMTGSTNFTALQDAFLDCGGSRRPCILQEGSSNYVVRMQSDKLSAKQIDYQVYQPKMVFEELPYIEDGEVI